MRTSEPDFEPGTLNPYVLTPVEVVSGDILGYKYVAYAHAGFPAWTAYRGPTGWSDAEVVNSGDAVPKEVAELIFPALANSSLFYYS